jgi:hypothetical protein
MLRKNGRSQNSSIYWVGVFLTRRDAELNS